MARYEKRLRRVDELPLNSFSSPLLPPPNTNVPSPIAYTDNLLGTGKVDKAALYSRAGDSLWASSGGLNLASNEIGKIARGFDEPSGLQSTGMLVQGQKYMLLRADDRSIYARHDAEGMVCVRTKQTIILAHYPPTVQAGEATKIVEQLADYLISVQY